MRSRDLAVLLTALPLLASAQRPSETPVLRVTLEDAIRTVDRASHPVAAARETSVRAAHDVVAARSGFLPRIVLTGSYVRTLESEFTGLFGGAGPLNMFDSLPFGRDHTWRGGVVASEQLFDGGRTKHTVALARGAERAADIDLRSRRAQAVLDVTDAYYAALLAARVVAIGEASLSLAEQTLEQTRLGFKTGTVAEFDVVRSQVTRETQRTQLIRARADRDQAFLRVRQLLGIPFDRAIELEEISGSIDEVASIARSAAGVYENERVVVAQARANVDMRRAEVGIARSGRYPTLNLVGDYGVVSYPDSWRPTGDWRTNWTVGVTVSFPLFTGFFVTADIHGARADQRAAMEILREAQEQAALDEARAVSDVDVAVETLAASQQNTALARRAYEIAEVRFRSGVATYLELVDARIAFNRAQIDEASAARDAAVSNVRLALLPALPLGSETGQRALAPSAVPSLVVTPPAAVPQPGFGRQL